MSIQSLFEIFPNASRNHEQALSNLYTQLQAIPGLFFGIVHLTDNQSEFLYLSPQVEYLTGYDRALFKGREGVQFFYSITPAKYFGRIFEKQMQYRKAALLSDFDKKKPHLLEIEAALTHKSGTEISVRCFVVALEYSNQGDPFLNAIAYQATTGLSIHELNESNQSIKNILIQFQQAYVQLWPDKYSKSDVAEDKPLKLFYPGLQRPNITDREHRVLTLIADGLSSKEIADRLNISFHTEETYRKNLLKKFDVKNSIELIKKASKIFWLD